MGLKVEKSEEEWRQSLSEAEYRVLREAATERPGTGEYLHESRVGNYYCKGCGAHLFDSSAKFDSGCGWPSFYQALPGAVSEHQDYSHGMIRVEIRCAACGGHLGHVFEDAPQTPTGFRYCMNSISMTFEPAEG